MKNLLFEIDQNAWYVIALVVIVAATIVIGCILVNRKERNEAKRETTQNYRNLNN
jgi:hypothetical protein